MSASTTIFRSNNNSAFYTALKSRSSVAGGKGCKAIYAAENQSCPSTRSKVEVVSANTAGYDRKISIPLANFGMLSKLFLRTDFAAGNHTAASHPLALCENIGAFIFSEARLVLDGHILARLTPEYILARYYKESHDEKRRAFQQLVGGYYTDPSTSSSPSDADSDTECKVRFSPSMIKRSKLPNQHYYCPLPFWFDSDESISRALDLSVLGQVFLELDINDKAYTHVLMGAGSEHQALNEIAAVQFLLELDPDEERQFRAVSYAPSQSLSQLGYNITQHRETITVSGSAVDIKLNMFSGQVSRLWVWATAEADDNNKEHFTPIPIAELKLTATGSTVYEMKHLGDNEQCLEDWVNGLYDTPACIGSANGSRWDAQKVNTIGTVVVPTITTANTDSAHTTHNLSATPTNAEVLALSNAIADNTAAAVVTNINTKVASQGQSISFTSSVNPNAVYCINFKEVGSDQRKTSATGSLAFGQLSTPNLNIRVADTTADATGVFGGEVSLTTASKAHVHIVAEELVLYNYATNNVGRTTLRLIST